VTLRAVARGRATVTATTRDGGHAASCKITVTQLVKSVKVDGAVPLLSGKTLKLKATVKPDDANNRALSWSTSKKSVATVDSKGKVTATAKGRHGSAKVTITATARDRSKKAGKATFKVYTPQDVQARLNALGYRYKGNNVLKIRGALGKEDAFVLKELQRQGMRQQKLGLSVSGRADAATLAALFSEKPPKPPVYATAVKLNKHTVMLLPGAEDKGLKAAVYPRSATYKTVVWRPSDTKVLTVDAKGDVKAVGKGSARITAWASDQMGAKASCSYTLIRHKAHKKACKVILSLD